MLGGSNEISFGGGKEVTTDCCFRPFHLHFVLFNGELIVRGLVAYRNGSKVGNGIIRKVARYVHEENISGGPHEFEEPVDGLQLP